MKFYLFIYCSSYLSGSLGNLKKAKSDWVLFRVQFGAAQKFGIFHSRRLRELNSLTVNICWFLKLSLTLRYATRTLKDVLYNLT